MADRYETDAWLVGELWKRCREMEDQIAELKKDLSVAEEFSRKQTEIIDKQVKAIDEMTEEVEQMTEEVINLRSEVQEVKDHRDRLILESASAARPMPSHKPEPEPEPEEKPEPEPKPQRKVKTGNKGRHGRFTEEEVQAMADRYEGGEDATSIAKEYGCTASTVYNLMNRRGISKQKQKNTKPTPKIDVGKVWALHDAGWDVKKICEEFVAAKATEEQIEEILAAPRPGRKKKVIEE